ncbi:MAG: HP1 family phage holin [Aggregatibacter segnis]|uniref:Holin n=1 Tax=Myoviridae sp. ctKZW4 TaxID=2826639 RepID=A0A8S5NBU3_9CAUD|nr:HP1 family phage holin [Haemophilus influenzae]MCK9153291.1 phage holin family protein [Haemophilus influenzae]DAD91847.1 MAG TPA: holin [Myoviridae sp. ctKZW4]
MAKMQVFKDMPIESQALGWVTGLFGALTLSEWAVLIGIIVTVCGYWRESRYKKRMLELEEIRAGIRDKNGNLINEQNS